MVSIRPRRSLLNQRRGRRVAAYSTSGSGEGRRVAAHSPLSDAPRTLAAMGRIRFDTATTLNGFLADSQHSLAWLFAVPGADDAERDIPTPDAAVDVMGSHSYEWMLRELDMLERPEKWAEFFGSTPVYVVTTRMLPAPRGADVRFVDGPVAELLPSIREAAGDGDIWVMGGGDLVGQFFDAGALDEVAVTIAPVTLDAGAPLLPRRIESDRLRLVEAYASGQFVRAVYEVLPSGP